MVRHGQGHTGPIMPHMQPSPNEVFPLALRGQSSSRPCRNKGARSASTNRQIHLGPAACL
eukprot:12756819-Ditylum_brightwellii.AAC.1